MDRQFFDNVIITDIRKESKQPTEWHHYIVDFEYEDEVYKKQTIGIRPAMVKKGEQLTEGQEVNLIQSVHGIWIYKDSNYISETEKRTLEETVEKITNKRNNSEIMAETITGVLSDLTYKAPKAGSTSKYHRYEGKINGDTIKVDAPKKQGATGFVFSNENDKDIIENGMKVTLAVTDWGYVLDVDNLPKKGGDIKSSKSSSDNKTVTITVDEIELVRKDKDGKDQYLIENEDHGDIWIFKTAGNDVGIKSGQTVELEIFQHGGKQKGKLVEKEKKSSRGGGGSSYGGGDQTSFTYTAGSAATIVAAHKGDIDDLKDKLKVWEDAVVSSHKRFLNEL